jgi:hypothetical protein
MYSARSRGVRGDTTQICRRGLTVYLLGVVCVGDPRTYAVKGFSHIEILDAHEFLKIEVPNCIRTKAQKLVCCRVTSSESKLEFWKRFVFFSTNSISSYSRNAPTVLPTAGRRLNGTIFAGVRRSPRSLSITTVAVFHRVGREPGNFKGVTRQKRRLIATGGSIFSISLVIPAGPGASSRESAEIISVISSGVLGLISPTKIIVGPAVSCLRR